jgi:O-antigen/teichoic acid export membrane protein
MCRKRRSAFLLFAYRGITLTELLERIRGNDHGAVLLRGATGSFAVMVLGAAAAFGVQIFLARLLGAAQYGVYVYVLTWINILALAGKLGLETSLMRFVAAYAANGQWGLLRGLLRRSVLYVVSASFLIGIAAAAVVWISRPRIGEEQAATFWVSLLMLPVLALVGLRQAALRALKRVVQAALPESVVRQAVLASFAAALWFFSSAAITSPQMMWLNLASLLVSFALGSFWLVRTLPPQVTDATPSYADQEWLRVSLPLFLMSGMYMILNQTDIIMVGIILGAEQAGIYAVASHVAGFVSFGLLAANTIVAPMISELHSTGQRRDLQRLMTLSARGVSLFVAAASCALALLGTFLLGLFGPEFVAAYVPLLVLLLGHVINSLVGSVGFLMTMTGHQDQAAWIVGVSAVVNILLNAALIQPFGMTGAATATAVATLLWNVAMLVYVRRRLNINPTVLAYRV